MGLSLLSEIGKADVEREEVDQRGLFGTVSPAAVPAGFPLGLLVGGFGRSEAKSKGKPSVFFSLSAWINFMSSKTLAPTPGGDRPTDGLASKVCQPRILCSPSLGMVALSCWC